MAIQYMKHRLAVAIQNDPIKGEVFIGTLEMVALDESHPLAGEPRSVAVQETLTAGERAALAPIVKRLENLFRSKASLAAL